MAHPGLRFRALVLAPGVGDATRAMDTSAAAWTADSGPATAEAGWLSATAAAAGLGVSQRTIRRAIARGELPATKHAGVYHIAPEDLARYEERRRSHVLPQTRPRPARCPSPTPNPRPRLRCPARDRP